MLGGVGQVGHGVCGRPRRCTVRTVQMVSNDELLKELARLKQENEAFKQREGAARPVFEPKKHGEQSRFLPFAKIEADQFFPRAVPFLGPLESISAEDVKSAAKVFRRYKAGKMMVSNQLAEPQVFIGLPGVFMTSALSDPVAFTAPIDPPGVSDGPDQSVVIVERDPDFFDDSPQSIYLWNTPGGPKLGWLKNGRQAQQTECLGEVATAFSKALINKDPTSLEE